MKKYLYPALVLSLVFALCACVAAEPGSNTIPRSDETTAPQPTETTAPQPTEHTCVFGQWEVVTAATCTEKGLKERKCACGESEQEEIPAGHTEVTDQAVAPTCTDDGLTEGRHCSVCHTVLVAQETDPALGHDYQDRVCSRCGKLQPSQGLAFTLNSAGNGYIVNGIGTCTDTHIVFPDTYNDLPVTGVNDWAFKDCTDLTAVTIPDSVTSIGYRAFFGCRKLESITIPNSVASIDDDAFEGCTSLESITIPDGVTSIGNSAFSDCTNLSSITIPDSVTGIGNCAFDGTAYYNDSANWENGVLYIGNHLIKAKDAVVSGNYTIKEGTVCIAGAAFRDCSNLESITIPYSVTVIGEKAFCLCSSLESITILDSVTSIGSDAFFGCSSLESITIPDSVASIGNNAFRNCINLNSITIPTSVSAIGVDAFSGTAYYNDSANWENGVLYIGNHLIKAEVVSDNYAIKEGTRCIAGSAFFDCTNLTGITIPNSVTSIGNNAFRNCTNLESLTIPDSVTSIGGFVFYRCTGLTDITYEGTRAQWAAIEKDNNWNIGTGDYTIHCTDGDISN